MSDAVKHECGVALLCLRRSPAYFRRKYGTENYGFGKLALLLEKQHNRGQDGAGIAVLRLEPEPGTPAYTVERSAAENPLADLFARCAGHPGMNGGVWLGHLRYATYGRESLDACHPFVHASNCLRRTLLAAGNFNLTNAELLLERFLRQGHHPASRADGYLITQTIAHYLEEDAGLHAGSPDWVKILHQALDPLDGAFTLCGMNGEGEVFSIRDRHGIRPGFFFFDDEIFAVASERPAIQAAFDCSTGEVMELPPGRAVVWKPDGAVEILDCLGPAEKRSCVFERIYFSRPNDADIHRERRRLGAALAPAVFEASGNDFDNTFFSYIPNSAQVSFHGMLEALSHQAFSAGKTVRFGQIAVKDAKFRTFIADAASRRDLYMHVYDVTYGLVRPGADTLVVLDDSIVRGNTMREAILPILGRLGAVRIVVASSAPPVKYPDCYGIDMACAGDLIAFRAVVSLLRRQGREDVLDSAYELAQRDLAHPGSAENRMKMIYDAVGEKELHAEIARLLTPPGFGAELRVVFQAEDDLRRCCPDHTGDWYFTGDYPTRGGVLTADRALVNFMENKQERAY